MTNHNPDDSTHPLNMDDDTRQATMALLDEEGGAEQAADPEDQPAATDDKADDEQGAAGEGTTDDGKPEGDGKADDTDTGDGEDGKKPEEAAAAGGEAGDGDGKADDGKVDRKAFDGVLAELRDTREQIKQIKAQHAAVPELPEPKDFKAEKDALKEKWEAGDLDTEDYQEQRETLTLEEAEHRAAVRFHQMQQSAQQESVNAAWQTKVQAWEQDNADFLANPIRRKAVEDLLTTLDSDPNNKLSDDELLVKVQETAFDAFNWKPEPASDAALSVNPRQQAAARAAAAASAVPPSVTGGVGNAAATAKADLEAVAANPDKFGKQARQAVDTVLGEEA